jgi:hypothetical protein
VEQGTGGTHCPSRWHRGLSLADLTQHIWHPKHRWHHHWASVCWLTEEGRATNAASEDLGPDLCPSGQSFLCLMLVLSTQTLLVLPPWDPQPCINRHLMSSALLLPVLSHLGRPLCHA